MAPDDAAVSVETTDDVMLQSGGTPSLHQLKHSVGTSPRLTAKNDGLWKTIGNWLSLADWTQWQFVFVTCAELASDSGLESLTETARQEPPNDAIHTLEVEADAVINPPTSAGEKKPPEYKVRKPACKRFLDLDAAEREQFVSRITLITSNFNAGDVTEQVKSTTLGMYPAGVRNPLASRLVEWWDRRVARSLLGQAPREITKNELLEQLSQIHSEVRDPSLPDDFSSRTPESFDTELGGYMERQIIAVDGGEPRIIRAARDRWRARNQREKWLEDDLAFAGELTSFDEKLVEAWSDKHGPMRHDMADADEEEQKAAGRKLLDWSHSEAALSGIPIRADVSYPFFIRGSLKQLSEELAVGWHPEFELMFDVANVRTGWRCGSQR